MAWAVWITGLPGSGKTTIAREVTSRINERKLKLLQLDKIRTTVTPHPRYTEEERDIVYSFLAYTAKVLTECGVNVIIDATANRQRYRQLARTLIPCFAEVYITCSLETCMRREAGRDAEFTPKDIYEKARTQGAAVPGFNVDYEASEHPEVTIDSERITPTQAAEIISDDIRRRFDEAQRYC
ncbi:MAG: adenylyl-sulfate kinase [Halobacteriota archaeon]